MCIADSKVGHLWTSSNTMSRSGGVSVCSVVLYSHGSREGMLCSLRQPIALALSSIKGCAVPVCVTARARPVLVELQPKVYRSASKGVEDTSRINVK